MRPLFQVDNDDPVPPAAAAGAAAVHADEIPVVEGSAHEDLLGLAQCGGPGELEHCRDLVGEAGRLK